MLKMKIRMMTICVLVLLVVPIISAGIGIKTTKEALIVDEGKKVCLRDYSVYNPWPDESYVTVEVSGELEDVLQVDKMEPRLVPAYTYHDAAIPVEFCFKIPKVYDEDCLIGDLMFCEQTCEVDQETYDGEIVVKSVPAPTEISGSGGSVTAMAVSAPLKLKVRCDAHLRSYTPGYVILAVMSVLVLGFIVFMKARKPAKERKKDKMQKLEAEMKKLKKSK